MKRLLNIISAVGFLVGAVTPAHAEDTGSAGAWAFDPLDPLRITVEWVYHPAIPGCTSCDPWWALEAVEVTGTLIRGGCRVEEPLVENLPPAEAVSYELGLGRYYEFAEPGAFVSGIGVGELTVGSQTFEASHLRLGAKGIMLLQSEDGDQYWANVVMTFEEPVDTLSYPWDTDGSWTWVIQGAGFFVDQSYPYIACSI